MFLLPINFHKPLIVTAASIVAAVTIVTSIAAQQATRALNVDASVLKAAASPNDPNAGLWLSYGRNQNETRYSPLKQINAANAKNLGLEWTYTLGAGGGNQEGTPLVWNNTIYGITNWSVVYALDGKTGKQIWRWDPEVNQQAVRPKLCCGIVNRGIAIYNGAILAPVIDGRLVSIDALTGKINWEARLAYPQDWYSITMAPRVGNGKVFIGMAGGDHPTRGFVDAYDIATGKRVWRFYNVPGDPSKPYENEAMKAAAKTWGGDFYKNGGGGSVWDSMTFDPDTNMVYYGTGNAEPWVQKFRGAQNVDNLYTCSIIALDANTGQMKWHYQEVPNDNWDYDAVQHIMLLDLNINGRQRKVLVQAAKDGIFYVLDRVTGEFLSGTPYAQVNWTRGFDAKGRPDINPVAFYGKEPVTVVPTAGGAHNWSPMSYNPATGLVYLPTTYGSWTFVAGDEVVAAQTGHTGLGRNPPNPPQPFQPIMGPPPIEGQRGILQAWDPVKKTFAWRVPGGGGIGGGTVTTAGNLVIQVINDGRLMIYTADKGEKLFETTTGRNGSAPPITYAIDGKQYIAFQSGSGRPATTYGPTDAPVDNAPLLYVFSLDGKAEMPKNVAPVQPIGGRGGRGANGPNAAPAKPGGAQPPAAAAKPAEELHK